ncbi:YbhN family protein [Mycoplasmopsis hyopharyngis]|uniref:lysylphosphatidylglycerol synthase transmembrane domain-containing protein n=1 Tax=Mycoplasmopsis hyopharyngis TaxID=29558 RepID=UPI00387336D0
MKNIFIFNKWKKQLEKDELLQREFKKFNNNKPSDKEFARNFFIVKNKIVSKIGIGFNLINEFTMTAIAKSFIHFINLKNQNIKDEKKNIFISFTDNLKIKKYIDIFTKNITEAGFENIVFEKNNEIPNSLKTFASIKNNCLAIVDFNNFFETTKGFEISFFHSDGLEFNDSEMQILQAKIKSTDYFNLELSSKGVAFNYDKSFLEYQNRMKEQYIPDNLLFNNKKISFTIDIQYPDHKFFYNSFLQPLHTNIKLIASKKFASHKKFIQSDSHKILNYSSMNYLNKDDAIFAINDGNKSFNFAIKYKRRMKYLTSDEIAALYLNFLLNEDPLWKREKFNSPYIIKNVISSKLVNKIAEENNIEVFEINDQNEIQKIKTKQKNKTFMFSYSNHNEFNTYKNINSCPDAINFILEVMRMVSYYKNENKNLFDVLTYIYDKYGKRHTIKKQYQIDEKSFQRFIHFSKQSEKFGSYKVANKWDYNENPININNKKVYKFALENDASIFYEYKPYSKTLTIFTDIRALSNSNDDIMKMTLEEKEIQDTIIEIKEDTFDTKNSVTTYIKYGFLSLAFVAIVIWLILSVFSLKDNDLGGEGSLAFLIKTSANLIFQDWRTRISFFIIPFSIVLSLIINSFLMKRLMNYQNEKVKWYDLFVSSAIGVIVQNITPKSIGGDIATYWYLRKKKFSRSKLLTTMVSSTIMWQMANIVLAMTIIPIGIYFYWGVFSNPGNNIKTKTFTSFLVLGLIFDSMMAFFFFILAIHKRFQKFVLKWFVIFLEWLPFIKIYDADALRNKYECELFEVRKGMKLVFRNPLRFFEILFYKILPYFITGLPLLAYFGEILQPNLKGGFYFNMIAGLSLIRSANSISPTPGGIGTSEWLSLGIFESLLNDGYNGLDVKSWAKIITSINTLGTVLIPSLLSALLFMNVIIIQKRYEIFRKKQIIDSLDNNSGSQTIQSKKTNATIISLILWITTLTLATAAFFFLPVTPSFF